MFFLKITLSVFLFFSSSAAWAVLTRNQAYELMKNNGYKWKLTQTLTEDAEAKKLEADSAFKPRFQLAMKQYYAKFNPIQFGGENNLTLDQIAFGTTGVEVSWMLLDPAAKAKTLMADASLEGSKEKMKQHQLDLAGLMLLQYLNVQRLKRQIGLMDANLEKSTLIHKLAQARKNVGAGIPLDIARSKNLVELDKLKKISTTNKYNKALHELAIILGMDSVNEDLEPLTPHLIEPDSLPHFLQRSTDQRADLKSAEHYLQAAQNGVEQSQKIFQPKMMIFGDVGSTQNTGFGLPAKTLTGFIGLGFSIPLETGGLLTAKRREAAILAQQADYQLQQSKLEINSQVREALEQITSAQEALQASENYFKTAQEETSIAEKRYSQGASNILDFTTSRTNLMTAQDTLTESIFNYEAAKLNYYHVLGSFDELFAASPITKRSNQ